MQIGSVMHLWWCQNETEGKIRDSIFYSALSNIPDSVFTPPPAAVLRARPTPPLAWDSFHVCDPSVIAGQFYFGGDQYRYALFYLGNDVDAGRHNQIGVAFSFELDGPWQRMPRPIVPHPNDGSWGVGQPSAIDVDGSGSVVLFYTRGDRTGTRTYAVSFDSGDFRRDAAVKGAPIAIPTAGLTRADAVPTPGATVAHPDILNDADFALDPRTRRLWAVRERHPSPTSTPTYIGSSVQLASIPFPAVLKGAGPWRVEAEIDPALTGYPRNHNAAIVRDRFGRLPFSDRIDIVFSTAEAGATLRGERAEWTYNLFRVAGRIT